MERLLGYEHGELIGVSFTTFTHPDDVDAQARVADIDLAMGRIDAAFTRLLDVVRVSAGEDRDKARRHLLRLFEIFPPRDARVTKARSTLSSLLF